MKRTMLIVGALGAMTMMSACANDYGYRGAAYGDNVYYDGYYGAYSDGYWGRDGFYYRGGDGRYMRDQGNHFRRDRYDGYRGYRARDRDHDHDHDGR